MFLSAYDQGASARIRVCMDATTRALLFLGWCILLLSVPMLDGQSLPQPSNETGEIPDEISSAGFILATTEYGNFKCSTSVELPRSEDIKGYIFCAYPVEDQAELPRLSKALSVCRECDWLTGVDLSAVDCLDANSLRALSKCHQLTLLRVHSSQRLTVGDWSLILTLTNVRSFTFYDEDCCDGEMISKVLSRSILDELVICNNVHWLRIPSVREGLSKSSGLSRFGVCVANDDQLKLCIDCVASVTALRSLSVRLPARLGPSVISELTRLPNIRELDVDLAWDAADIGREKELSKQMAECLGNAQNVGKLEKVSLTGARKVDERFIESLARMPALHSLRLISCEIGESALLPLSTSSIRSLQLAGIGQTSVSVLSKLITDSKFKTLALEFSESQNFTQEIMAAIGKNVGIKRLVLSKLALLGESDVRKVAEGGQRSFLLTGCSQFSVDWAKQVSLETKSEILIIAD